MGSGLAATAVIAMLSLSSQVGRLWTFDDLATESDVVLIGKASGARDTGRKGTHSELRPGTPVLELETDIEVLTVLKRAATIPADDLRRVVVRHYRVDVEEWRKGQPPPAPANRRQDW